MLSYYLKEVLGVRSFVLPMTAATVKPQFWIVSDQNLQDQENDLLGKMLQSVKMEVSSFKILSLDELSKAEIQNKDFILFFSDAPWSEQEANVIALPAFHRFFELEGDELKNLKKLTWEKLKAFAAQQI